MFLSSFPIKFFFYIYVFVWLTFGYVLYAPGSSAPKQEPAKRLPGGKTKKKVQSGIFLRKVYVHT